MAELTQHLQAWKGEVVVVDCAEPFIIIGTLQEASADHLELTDADLHDLRDTETTRELYAVKTARHGVQANRATLLVRMEKVLGVSRLSDVETG